jgi:hypothetical protein
VSGASDCGDGVLEVNFTTPGGKSISVQLTWTSAPHGLQAFSGAFVVPQMRAGVIDVSAVAFCRDASYENSSSTTLRVLGKG